MGLLVQRRWEIHLVKKMVAEIEPDKRCYLFNTFSPYVYTFRVFSLLDAGLLPIANGKST